MKPKFDFVDFELGQIKKNNLYRELRYGSINGSAITMQGKNLINLSSNDYLGIPPTNLKIKQIQSSSRLVSGNDEIYKTLEEKLAKHKSQESSLIYPTGYMANLGAISTIAKNGDLICSDEFNHVSVIEACKLAGAKVSVFKHNDMKDLRKKLEQKVANKYVITEGVFSMDGEFSRLPEIVEIAQKEGAITILDDAHGDFVVGQDGKGTPNHFGVSKKIDLYISSLSKGLGSFGGYIASRKNVIDLNINRSKSFIYTSALPAILVEHALKRFDSDRKKPQEKLLKNTKFFSSKLKQIGYNINSQTHIIPIIIGNEKITMEFSKFLFENNLYAQAIRYPTVPKNKARVRISITAMLSDQEINYSMGVFEQAFRKFIY